MDDKETPRSMIQGYLKTADTQKSDVMNRKRRPIPRTPQNERDRLSKSLPGIVGERSSDFKRRRISQTQDITPRSMIEGFVTSTKTVMPSVKKTRRRRSVATPVADITDITIDKFTPRTNIQGILSQGYEETPYERPVTRSGRRSELPPIPLDRSINLRLSSSGSPTSDEQRRPRMSSKKEKLADKVRRKQFNFHQLSLRGKENRPTTLPPGESDVDYPTPQSGTTDHSSMEAGVSSQEGGTLGDIESGEQTSGSQTSPFSTSHSRSNDKSPQRRSPRTSVQERSRLINTMSPSSKMSSSVAWSPVQSPRSSIRSRRSLTVGNSPSISRSAKHFGNKSGEDLSLLSGEPNSSLGDELLSKANINDRLDESRNAPDKNKELGLNSGNTDRLTDLHMSVPVLDISVPGAAQSQRNSPRRMSMRKSSPSKSPSNLDHSKNISHNAVDILRHSSQTTSDHIFSLSPGKGSINNVTPRKFHQDSAWSPRRSLRSTHLSANTDGMNSLAMEIDNTPDGPIIESERTSPIGQAPASGETTGTRGFANGTDEVMEYDDENKIKNVGQTSQSRTPEKFTPAKILENSPVTRLSRRKTPEKLTPAKNSPLKRLSRGVTRTPEKLTPVKALVNSPLEKRASSMEDIFTRDSEDNMNEVEGYDEPDSHMVAFQLQKQDLQSRVSVSRPVTQTTTEGHTPGYMVPDVSVIPRDGEEYTEEVSELNTTELYRIKTPHLQSAGPSRQTPVTSTPVPNQGTTLAQQRPVNTERRKPRALSSLTSLSLPPAVIKQTFNHFCKMKVAKDTLPQLIRITDKFFDNVMKDLEAYAHHSRRATIDETDVELLMKRQGYITKKQSLTVLIEKHLPRELRQEIIPMATSKNHIVPE